METRQETLKFDSFVKLSEVSAQRSRGLISILMVASFVSLLALYNSLPVDQNWLYSRLRSLQAAQQWMRFDESLSGPNEKVCFTADKGKKRKNKFTIEEMVNLTKFDTSDLPKDYKILHKQISLAFPDYCINNGRVDISKIDYEQLSQALHYVTGPKVVASKSELERVIAYYNRSIIENSLSIRMPFLGIAFDVNSLAIISAVAFGLIFFLLYFYLMRERKNLVLLFELAEDMNISKVKIYQLLSMNQVLTVPGSIDQFIKLADIKQETPPIDQTSWHFLINKAMTFAPMLFACIVWITIFCFDIYSMNIGAAYNAKLTALHYYLSGSFGFIMFIFLILTFVQWNKLNKVWEDQRWEIIKILRYGRESGFVSKTHLMD